MAKAKAKVPEEDEIDYGATADMHASDDDTSMAEGEDAEAIEGAEEAEDDDTTDEDEDQVEANDEDQADGTNDKEEEEEEGSSGREEDGEEEEEEYPSNHNIVVDGGDEPCTFDLRNLLAFNAHPIDTAVLYAAQNGKNSKQQPPTGRVTIPSMVAVDEKHLYQKAEAGCQQLIAALWQLPTERSDAGPMVKLPTTDDSRVPRALPLPPPNVETKWEKFAKAKGIGMNKTKRSRKVWDESTGEWKFRHGYDKANASDGSTWPIMEVKPGDDPYLDPWEKQREAKKARVDKNVEQRMRNVERSGGLAKGSTTRTLKHIAKARESGRSGGAMDRNVPAGVPVDLKPVGKKGNGALNATGAPAVTSTKVLRGKESTLSALRASQRSTASLGNFDKMREGEPERKAPKLKKKSSSKPVESKSELETSLKVLKSMASGGSVEREKLKKKGTLAHGETAYDYDYTDGLGASTFRKKKGRAGAGKAKKLTKKRVK